MSTRHPESRTRHCRTGATLILAVAAATSLGTDPSSALAAGAGHTLAASHFQALSEISAGGYRLQATTDLIGTAQAGKLSLQPGILAIYAGGTERLLADGFE